MLSALRGRVPLRTRAQAVELLDSGALSRDEVEMNLADLARLNRLPGGTGASIHAIRTLVGDGQVAHVLDVGTGGGDMPVAFARAGWKTTAVDVNPEVLRVARARTRGTPAIEIVEGDVRLLPFDDAAFDVAHCSLLIHHLEPHEVPGALRELARVARHGVVINDLRRGALPMVATVVAATALGRSRVTRADAVASARRAYTLGELDGHVERAGLAPRWRSSPWMPRVVTALRRA